MNKKKIIFFIDQYKQEGEIMRDVCVYIDSAFFASLHALSRSPKDTTLAWTHAETHSADTYLAPLVTVRISSLSIPNDKCHNVVLPKQSHSFGQSQSDSF